MPSTMGVRCRSTTCTWDGRATATPIRCGRRCARIVYLEAKRAPSRRPFCLHGPSRLAGMTSRTRSVRAVGVGRKRSDVDALLYQLLGFVERCLAVDVAMLDLAIVDLARLFREFPADVVGIVFDVFAQPCHELAHLLRFGICQI